nr:glycosyltransferase [Motilibacter aurantiacus]
MVVVPTRGERLDYLAACLRSVTSQSGVDVRCVVVSSPSDAVQELGSRLGASVVPESGRGISAAINQGWQRFGDEADYWAWLGDDDLLAPGSLSATTAALRSAPRASMAYGPCAFVDAEDSALFVATPGRIGAHLLGVGPNLVPQPGSLQRAAAVRRVGYLDETLKYAMDLDLFLRLRTAGPLRYVPRTLAAFRWHEGSTTVAAFEASGREAADVRRRNARNLFAHRLASRAVRSPANRYQEWQKRPSTLRVASWGA